MKTVRINGIEEEIPAGLLVFDDFLRNLTQQLEHDQQVIASIRLNGRELSEAEENALRAQRIEEVEDIEVQTSSPIDLAYQTLDTLEQYLDRIMLSIDRAAKHYRAKNYMSADTYFAKSIDGLDLFVQTIGGVKLALRIGLNQTVALTEATLVSIMNDLLDAKRQNNYLFLADLLEKDLIENLTDWRTKVFPIFRAWKTA